MFGPWMLPCGFTLISLLEQSVGNDKVKLGAQVQQTEAVAVHYINHACHSAKHDYN